MTVKHTLVSLDMRVFALCSLMELHRGIITSWNTQIRVVSSAATLMMMDAVLAAIAVR